MTTAAAAPETHQFQAETARLLEIVVHSLYTDREVFIRELISNAADALEKFRHVKLTNADIPDSDAPLEISIETDEPAKLFAIRDNGIGMTHDEIVAGLGTIAHSGTREFLKRLQATGHRPQDDAEGSPPKDVSLIGQFGVGFYSAFMVAKKVTVETRSYHADSTGWVWESDGSGAYTISPREGLSRGTRIAVELRDDATEFSRVAAVQRVIQRFSSFVPFPVRMGGTIINTVQAIWLKNRADVTENDYVEFYRFTTGESVNPMYRLHFTSDVPLDLHVLLFVPHENFERLGFGKIKPGVDLYSKRVLIEKHPEDLLPEWMRFVRGVVDSEDLPLNISRESMQDSTLLRRISRSIATRFVKFLDEQAREDAALYNKFCDQFGSYIREGAAMDYEHRGELAKLLRYESSKTAAGERTSLADYVSRMAGDQKEIYFISGHDRASIEAMPYLDIFRERGLEVIFAFDPADDVVFGNLREFDGKQFKSADSPDIKLGDVESKEGEELSKEEADGLCGWLKETLGDGIASVRVSKRLVKHPALIVGDGTMTNSMRRVMGALGKLDEHSKGGLTLEINPRHEFVRSLAGLRGRDGHLAHLLAEQLRDNALLAAGLLADPSAMVERLNTILLRAAK